MTREADPYAGFKIRPDHDLIRDAEAARTGATYHWVSGRVGSYRWCCKSGQAEGAAQAEKQLRAFLFSLAAKNKPGVQL